MIKEIDTFKFDYDIEQFSIKSDMSNKLFCTFSNEEGLQELIDSIQSKYKVIYNKIFVLYSKNEDEYLCTYNVDLGNIAHFPDNTILVHRKKETNTLYTINALNTLIKSLNGGILDTNYRVNWSNYRNSILLTKGPELKHLNTKLYKIIEI